MRLHRLREWRILRGMTQEDLAQAIGMSESNVNRLENGKLKRCKDCAQVKIWRVLDITPNEFFLLPPLHPDTLEAKRKRERFFLDLVQAKKENAHG